jgi:predicted Ser/Thr protein kinase
MLAAGIPTNFGEGSTAGPPLPPLPISEIAKFFPQLEILDCLGRGGMGVLYRARQAQLDRTVALKILAPEKENDPAFAERFTREAQALARLNHPNIVTVYDFGQADGLYYLLMEFVEGMNLRQLLRAGRLAPTDALKIIPKICDALQFAHQQGIVHRDIKPENILLDTHGHVKIADFGIAKLIGLSPNDPLTHEQHTVGTPHYMAPEQVERPASVDHRADIYSLGVVFYEMLTGELPIGKFCSPSARVQVDVRLDEVVLRALEKEPARRYQQAEALKTDLEMIAAHPSSAQVSLTPDQPKLRRNRRNFARLALSMLLAGTLGTLIVMSFSHRHDLALVFGGLALALAIVFGAVAWSERMGRTVVYTTLTLILGLAMAGAVLTEFIPFPFSKKRVAAEQAIRNELDKTAATLAAAATFETVPPVVTSTFPPAGSLNVDPALTQLEVTFSKSMRDQSWSFVKLNDAPFPQLVGHPRFMEGTQKCIVPVKLERATTYALWFNNNLHQNFTDQHGRPALPYLLVFKTKD